MTHYKRLIMSVLLMATLVSGMLIACGPSTQTVTPPTSTQTSKGSISGAAAFEMVRAAADTYFSSGKELNTINAETLYKNLTDGNTKNDPFIISSRTPVLYRTGHVCGAINIPLRSTFLETNWELEPPKDATVVLYSETGNEGGEIVSLMNILGWNVTPLLWGFTSWYK
jgi:rhodanese-related sulfurtransferase